MPLVTQWIGRGIKAFRTAIRMSVLEFAHKLGVSDRIVTRWETGGAEDIPRMVNQAALDTLLAQADPDVHGRFLGLLAASDGPALHQLVEPEKNEILSGRYTKHPRDGRLMAHVPEGIFLSGTDCEPTWVDEFYIDTFPVTNADYARFCTATGHAPPRHSEGGRCPRPLYDHPAVEVSWRDACAFADWAGESLPSALQPACAASPRDGPRSAATVWMRRKPVSPGCRRATSQGGSRSLAGTPSTSAWDTAPPQASGLAVLPSWSCEFDSPHPLHKPKAHVTRESLRRLSRPSSRRPDRAVNALPGIASPVLHDSLSRVAIAPG